MLIYPRIHPIFNTELIIIFFQARILYSDQRGRVAMALRFNQVQTSILNRKVSSISRVVEISLNFFFMLLNVLFIKL